MYRARSRWLKDMEMGGAGSVSLSSTRRTRRKLKLMRNGQMCPSFGRTSLDYDGGQHFPRREVHQDEQKSQQYEQYRTM